MVYYGSPSSTRQQGLVLLMQIHRSAEENVYDAGGLVISKKKLVLFLLIPFLPSK